MNCDVPKILLYYTGINLYGKKNVEFNRYTALFLLVIAASFAWYVVFVSIVGPAVLGMVTTLGFLIPPALANSVWFLLYGKRHLLKQVFDQLRDIPVRNQNGWTPLFQVCTLIFLLIVYPSFVVVIYMQSLHDFCSPCDGFYTMMYSREELGTAAHLIFATLSVWLTQFTKTTLLCLVGMVYSSLCYRCRCKIVDVIHRLSAMEASKGHFELQNVLRYFQKTLKTISNLEEVFSAVMLMSVLVSFMTIFTGLSILFFTELNVYKISDIAVIVTLNVANLVSSIAFAAEIPQQVREVNARLCEVNEDMSFSPSWTSAKSSVEAMLQREVPILSACNVFYFNRGFILASVGSLLTYGILVKQFGN